MSSGPAFAGRTTLAEGRLLPAVSALGRALANTGARHMLIGGVAVIARGIRRLTDDVDAKTKDAFAAAKRFWEGKRPLTISHVPHGQAPRNQAVEIPVEVESDPLALVAELVVSYWLLGAGAFSVSRAAPDEGKVEIPAAFLGSAGGSRVEYYVTALDRTGNQLVALGSPGEDGMVEIVSGLAPGETVVTSGQFLLDAESRFREAIAKHLDAQRLAPEAGGATPSRPAPGHVH